MTLELLLCRTLVPHYLVIDALGEFHTVSFVGVCICVQASFLSVNIVDDHVVHVSPTGAVWEFSF